ncbi:hypothetical protein BH24GEM3_BH24GEM3_21670 [soil metagenome]|jgi:very-short-patch-repair endonuclease
MKQRGRAEMAFRKEAASIRGTRPEIEKAARELRKEPTLAERTLWEAISKRRLGGLRFRRQHPVGRFILDFYCPGQRLAIELDGEVHDSQTERDAERTAVLQAAGIRVLRFRNEQVLHELPVVLHRIASEVHST